MACSSSKPLPARDVADANDTGRTLAARNQAERQLLEKVAGLRNDRAEQVGGLSVVAEAPYAAASGRTCRALSLKQAGASNGMSRVACTDGKQWFFVPDVFGANEEE